MRTSQKLASMKVSSFTGYTSSAQELAIGVEHFLKLVF